jgi:hypothetical protein
MLPEPRWVGRSMAQESEIQWPNPRRIHPYGSATRQEIGTGDFNELKP